MTRSGRTVTARALIVWRVVVALGTVALVGVRRPGLADGESASAASGTAATKVDASQACTNAWCETPICP
jgi:hypothetical protein